MQERVLLPFIKAVDLVDKEECLRRTKGARLARSLNSRAYIGRTGADGRELHKAHGRLGRYDPRERGLAAPRRPEEDGGEGPAGFDRGPQYRPRPHEVLLPDELGERAWAHARRERRLSGGLFVVL